MSNKEIMRVITEITWGIDVKAISDRYASKEEFITKALKPQVVRFVRRFDNLISFSEDEKVIQFVTDFDEVATDAVYSEFLTDLTNCFNLLHRMIIPHRRWLGDDTAALLDTELKKFTDKAIAADHKEKEIARRASIDARKQERKP
mgnify:CR=1 FL=1